MRVLRGTVKAGVGDAKNWPLEQIRSLTGRSDLIAGTLNVELDEPHAVRRDYTLHAASRNDGRREDLYFEECLLLIGSKRVPALIARTSTNYHGQKVLEIMAAEFLRSSHGLCDGDVIKVQVRGDEKENPL
jgi:CTP-dependent riboflavin kinase